jgi:hypothetical protein
MFLLLEHAGSVVNIDGNAHHQIAADSVFFAHFCSPAGSPAAEIAAPPLVEGIE